jgi:hypothetical protein
MSRVQLSRRGFLQAVSLATGAAIGTRLGGRLLPLARAQAVTQKSALVILYLDGGYNSLFTGADAFLTKGDFGVTNDNIADLGNGLVVDGTTFGTMPDVAKQHMASIGVRHGTTSHEEARQKNWTMTGDRAYPLILASAMGGDAAIKCAAIGDRPDMNGVSPPAEDGVSLQTIKNMDATIRALGGGAPDPKIPDRDIASKAIAASEAMSAGRMTGNDRSLKTVKDGYDTAVQTLQKPVKPFSFTDLANAYNQPTTQFGVDSFRSKMVAAELMVLAGANVVTIGDGGWDSHDDTDGSGVRDQMSKDIIPSLNIFLDRMLNNPDFNVVFTIMGDFARSLPGSDHQPNLTTTVIGRGVKVGTTGKTDADVGLPSGSPGVAQYWSFLAKALKLPTEPFGANPHALLL